MQKIWGVYNYKLRDQFIVGRRQGLQNKGKTDQVKALELQVSELEKALGRKTLEVEVLKKRKIIMPPVVK
ncbi:MAG TPA: hypothetical protein DCY71_01690, partial [Clostridiaceae bacterium]|nr:hypothetical protein [Clostridiaceae bacterium]